MLATGAESPAGGRERLLLDFNWRFELGDAPDAGTKFNYPEVSDLAKTHIDEIGRGAKLIADLPGPAQSNLGADVSFVKPAFDDSHWRALDLPHDWAVELPFSTNADFRHGFKPVGPGFPESSIGWYRREFALPASDRGKTLWVEFDGVYRNSLVWLNGHCLGRNVSGYGSFRYDISEFANCGGKNELVVRVDASRFEGWFYEGAGIYRHVWLVKTSALHFKPEGIFVFSQFTNNNLPGNFAEVHVKTQIEKSSTRYASVKWKIFAPDGELVSRAVETATIDPDTGWDLEETLHLSPKLWSPETPNLYKLVVEVLPFVKFADMSREEQTVASIYQSARGDMSQRMFEGTNVADRVEIQFGIRTVAFDAEKGFLLNGKPYVIKGTCNHQDHAGVGSAMPDALQYFRVRKLKEMGSNAIRTSHNPPTPALLEACDQLGMLVMDENRRVDETEVVMNDLRRMILRD
ncbi:MAG TPA: glycoside hydrolase family 2 TIM barrel-domain containing protein, partial [Verrucomicrobiae bacterium]